MVSRYLVRCHGCKERLVLRVQVSAELSPSDPGGTQPFVFACPRCRVGVHARLTAERGRGPHLVSEDFDVLEDAETGAEVSVTVATDVPVHCSFLGRPSSEAKLTPFIQLVNALGSSAFDQLMPALGSVRSLREDAFPYVRRASSFFMMGDLPGVIGAIAEAVGATDVGADQVDAVDLLRVSFGDMYAPLEDGATFSEAADEASTMLSDARAIDARAFDDLLGELEGGPLAEHRRRVIDTALTALDDVDALFPAMWVEHMEGKLVLDDYRVMRDDFDVLKSRYQDAFELGSRSLAFMSRAANIARRGDVRMHADGKRRSLKEAVDRTAASTREAWLVDFPRAATLFSGMKRHTRNDIGHRLVRYDFETGALVYDDGDRENYLHFLVDYLHSVRLTHHLVDVALVLWKLGGPRRVDAVQT